MNIELGGNGAVRETDPSPRRLADRYVLHELIGSGGMGSVHRAHDERLDRPVAVKLLAEHLCRRPDALGRFEREARAAGRLSHLNVVAVHDYGHENGIPYLVMELLPGATLADRIAEGPMSEAEVTPLARDMLAALQCAHGGHVLHRDVKPGNILLADDGCYKLGDFGIAKIVEADDATKTVELLATPRYLAPERMAGAPASTASDLYSLAVVLYESLAGRPPFEADSPIGVLRAAEQGRFPPLATRRPDIEPRLASAIDAALHADPEGRPRDASAMAAALGIRIDAGPPPLPSRRRGSEPDATTVSDGSGATQTLHVARSPRTEGVGVLGPRPEHAAEPRPKRRLDRFAWLAIVLGVALFTVVLALRSDADDATTPAVPPTAVTAGPVTPTASLPPGLAEAVRDLEKAVAP